MYIYESKSGNQKVAVGVVTEIKEITKDGVKKVIVKLKDWRGDTLDIFFSNKPGDSAGKQLADRVVNAKLHTGSYIAALVVKTDDATNASGLNFQFSGMFNLKDFNESGEEIDVTIIIGRGCRPRAIKEGMYAISMPVRNKDGETEWISVSFFDGEKAKDAEKAAKIFQDNARTCCVRGGSIRTNEKDGVTYKNLTAFRLEAEPRKE